MPRSGHWCSSCSGSTTPRSSSSSAASSPRPGSSGACSSGSGRFFDSRTVGGPQIGRSAPQNFASEASPFRPSDRPTVRLYARCLRSEGRRRANRVRTSPVAALSVARCRFGEPGALFFSGRRADRSDRQSDRPPTMAIALARRYRPRRFSDLLVQDHVAAVLRGAVQRDRVGHGYLLTGPRGVGKTTAARILAMALNCPRREASGDPCGECESCLRIWNGSASLDVVEIDAASNRGVDDARDLRERAMYSASQEGHYKVYIVDEAHMLTREAWNALLKILEEPPPRVVFVFATTEPQKIAATAAPVMSHLQRFDFRRIGVTDIIKRLETVLE